MIMGAFLEALEFFLIPLISFMIENDLATDFY